MDEEKNSTTVPIGKWRTYPLPVAVFIQEHMVGRRALRKNSSLNQGVADWEVGIEKMEWGQTGVCGVCGGGGVGIGRAGTG